MPKPQIPHNHTPPPHYRLTRRPLRPPRLQNLSPDPPAGALAMGTFLVRDRGDGMRAEPDFGGAVLGRHGYEGDVYHQSEGDGGVVEVGVRMGWLGGWWGGGGRR